MTCGASIYDRRSCPLHEKRYNRGYRFVKVEREGDEKVYKIDWKADG